MVGEGSEVTEIRERLRRDLAEVGWEDLRAHARRDALILVDVGIDLVDAAVAVAGDDRERVAAWIASGALYKPTRELLEAWEVCPTPLFLVALLQPYVLAQPRSPVPSR